MRQDIMLKLVSLMLIIVWLIILTIHLNLQDKKKKILSARTSEDLRDFNCATIGAKINFAKVANKVNLFCFGFVSLLLAVDIISGALLYFGEGAVNRPSFADAMLYCFHPAVSLAWLFCLGAWISIKLFIKFYILLSVKCNELMPPAFK